MGTAITMRWLTVWLALAAVTALAPVACAQTVTGALVGRVADASDSVITDARIVATEITRGVSRETKTNDQGTYTIASLEPGVYRVEIEREGFKKFVNGRVEVNINTTVRVDARMELGAVAESVQVVASASAIQLVTDRGDLSHQVQREQIENLPLSVDRNYQALLEMVPGSTEPETSGSSFGNPGGSLVNYVNGQNSRANGYQLDGTLNNQTNVIAQTAIVPPAEAIQVVDISTNAYDAEQGRASGAVVNVHIKSGTNQLHGSTFFYNTNSALRARNALSTVEKPHTNMSQGGFTLGGPLRRNRTFFFGDYQTSRDRRGQSTIEDVPTADYRRGDFSKSTVRVFDPLTGAANGSGRTQFPNNMIPPERISPIAKNIYNLLPLPNRAGEVANYEVSGAARLNRDSFDAKINHRFTERTEGFVRYSYFQGYASDPPIFESLGGPTSGGGSNAAVGPSRIQSASSNLTHILSPKLVTEFRAGLVRVLITGQAVGDFDIAQKVGIPTVYTGDFFGRGMPNVTITGYTSLGLTAGQPFKIGETSYNIVNNWTRQAGNHSVRWGIDLRDQIMNKYQAASDPRGVFTFARTVTGTSGVSTGNPNGIAAFLLGLPQSESRTVVQQLGGFRQRSYFFFIQDRWQAGPRLTFNYGLRYEIMPFATAANPGDESSYLPATNQALIAGYGNVNKHLNVNTDYRNFGPRLGLAYRVMKKTVVRAGYGIGYNPLPVNQLSAANYPAQLTAQWSGVNTYQPVGKMSDGFPAVPLVDVSKGLVDNPPSNLTMAVFNLNGRRGYVQSFNLTIEQELFGWVIANSYAGTLGTRMLGTQNINGAGPGKALADRPFYKLYGRTADVYYFDYMLSSAYHGYQLSAKRRLAAGGTVTVSYTLSKSLDYTDDWRLGWSLNNDVNRGPSAFDRKHNLVVSHVTELPFGKGQRLLRSGWPARIAGGFRVSGIFGARAGAAVNISAVKTGANATQGSYMTNRPDVIAEPALLKGVGPGTTWFDTSVFKEPAPGTLGNVSRNSVRGPGYVNYSTTLSRTFILTERFKLHINAAAFNLTNSAHYNKPTGSFSSSSFGRISTSYSERQVRLGARLQF